MNPQTASSQSPTEEYGVLQRVTSAVNYRPGDMGFEHVVGPYVSLGAEEGWETPELVTDIWSMVVDLFSEYPEVVVLQVEPVGEDRIIFIDLASNNDQQLLALLNRFAERGFTV